MFLLLQKIKEWLQRVGLGDDTTVVHDEDEPDDGAVPISNEDSARNRWLEFSSYGFWYSGLV